LVKIQKDFQFLSTDVNDNYIKANSINLYHIVLTNENLYFSQVILPQEKAKIIQSAGEFFGFPEK
jgi:hypothetical protein